MIIARNRHAALPAQDLGRLLQRGKRPEVLVDVIPNRVRRPAGRCPPRRPSPARVQKSCRSAATRISSSTAGCRPHEPALLLHQARGRPRSARWPRVIRLPAQQGDRVLRVETAQLLAAYSVELGPGCFPGMNPPPALGDLLGAPAREGLLLHLAIVTTRRDGPTGGRLSRSAPVHVAALTCRTPPGEPPAHPSLAGRRSPLHARTDRF